MFKKRLDFHYVKIVITFSSLTQGENHEFFSNDASFNPRNCGISEKSDVGLCGFFALLLLMIGGIALMQARWVYAIGSVLGAGGFALLAAEAAGRFKHQAAKVLSI